jgi:two-component system phosphate regulon sensor histidine kinase PhoR
MNAQTPAREYTVIMRTVRTAGSMLLLVLSAICLVVYTGGVTIADSYSWATLPLCLAFLTLAVLQGLWNPYSKRKISVFLNITLFLGALLTILVTGFSTLVYLSWVALELVFIMYFSLRRAIFSYFVLLGSLYIWLGLHLDHHRRPDVLTHYLSALGVGVLIGLFASVWRLTNRSIKQLEITNAKEDVERSQLTSLVNSMADGVIAVDTAAKVVLYNAAALNVLDLNSSMKGKSLKRYIKLVDKDQQPVDIIKLVLDSKLATVSRDYRIKYSDGSFANLYLSIAPVHLGYGQKGSQGFVLLLRDITREKSLEEERDEFISVVSHELRTPIAISEGNISNAQLIAKKDGSSAQITSALEEAHTQIVFLADMINDLATLSRAERGKLVLEVEDIDVEKLVTDLTTNYKHDAAAKGLTITSEIKGKLKPLSSSKLYVREVLQNFITNAIKYTETGSVTVIASQTARGTVFEVHDTGIGISKSDQERVFDKFFRSEDYRTRQNSGTGLGLYVTMKLTRLLHADIDLHSELNKGSTFRITIPNVKPEQAAKENAGAPAEASAAAL